MVTGGQRLMFVGSRVANVMLAVSTAAFGILSYSPFAYEQFIRPQLLTWLPDAVAMHHEAFAAVALLITCSLAGRLRRGEWPAWLFTVSLLTAAGWLVVDPVVATVGHNQRALIVGIVALLPVAALAVVDHAAAPPLRLKPVSAMQVANACVVASGFVWLVYTMLAMWRATQLEGVGLPAAAFAVAGAWSLAAHAAAFGLLAGASTLVLAAAGTIRGAAAQFWAASVLAAAAGTLVLHRIVASAISFRGAVAWLACAAVAAALSLAWSSVARHLATAAGAEASDAIDVWFAPLSIGRHAAVAAAAVPALAFFLVSAVATFDWNFLLQKLGVLLVWFVAFAGAWSVARSRLVLQGSGKTASAVLALLAIAGVGSLQAARADNWPTGDAGRVAVSLDTYAATDASFHLIRGLMRANTGEAAEFYALLRAHSTIGAVPIEPIEISFGAGAPPPASRPDIYLFIVDSLRPDYLSPYNARVTFTPGIARLASESFVFTRAFTRYGATGLSVPSIWAGGMLVHKQYVKPFHPMNALEKLLDANGYRRFISHDHIATQLFQRSPRLAFLDRGRREMDFTLCTTLEELQRTLGSASGGDPVFAMSRPLELHMANLTGQHTASEGRYPGFVAAYASRVHQFDGCLASFVDFLKATGRYDNSVIILTSDHGESLGEEGRWGHAYTLFPEVIRIPLIVRVPPALGAAWTTDPGRTAFSTDITPTLYALLGDGPVDRGVLYGASVLTRGGSAPARHGPFLLASSYGPVWGALAGNGERLFIADAIEGRDHAFAVGSDHAWRRVTMTDAVRASQRRIIADQIKALSSQYNFSPQP